MMKIGWVVAVKSDREVDVLVEGLRIMIRIKNVKFFPMLIHGIVRQPFVNVSLCLVRRILIVVVFEVVVEGLNRVFEQNLPYERNDAQEHFEALERMTR